MTAALGSELNNVYKIFMYAYMQLNIFSKISAIIYQVLNNFKDLCEYFFNCQASFIQCCDMQPDRVFNMKKIASKAEQHHAMFHQVLIQVF